MPARTVPIGLSALAGRTFAAVLFDLDGTLVDSTPAVARAWSSWASDRGLPAPDLAANHGRPAVHLVARMVPAAQVTDALAEFHARELADLSDVVVLPGAAELLRSAGDLAAVVTSGTRSLALARLAAAGLTPPAVTVTFDDVRQGKPHPEPFLLAARRLGVDPVDCLVVEDAPAGLAAAAAAGCATLAVLGTHAAPQLTGADAVVGALTEVSLTRSDHGVRLSAA